jgi:hypothetical protein
VRKFEFVSTIDSFGLRGLERGKTGCAGLFQPSFRGRLSAREVWVARDH